MDIISYRNKSTIKSFPVTYLNTNDIPNCVFGYRIDKNSIIKKKEDAIVYRCIDTNDIEYAIKISFKENNELLDKVANSNHQNIIKVVQKGFLGKGLSYQITPFYKNGTLDKMISAFNNSLFLKLTEDINSAIHFLHNELGIVHLDIKPENIYYDGNQFLLGDFDISKKINQRIDANSIEGTEGYFIKSDYELLNRYNSKLDYALLGNTLKYIVDNCSILNCFDVRNLISGLTNPDIEKRWGYQEVVDICNGKFIESGRMSTTQKLAKKDSTQSYFFGFDENMQPLSAQSLEELGNLFKRYRNVALNRHIKNKAAWQQMIRFVGNLDVEKSEKIKNILPEKDANKALDEIAFLLENNISLFYGGKKYNDIYGIVKDASKDKYDSELIDLINSVDFSHYLDGAPSIRSTIERMRTIVYGKDEVLYFLIIYLIGADKSFETDILKCDIDISVQEKMNILKKELFYNPELVVEKKNQIEAWLILNGYDSTIKKIREVSNKYE